MGVDPGSRDHRQGRGTVAEMLLGRSGVADGDQQRTGGARAVAEEMLKKKIFSFFVFFKFFLCPFTSAHSLFLL